MARSADASLRDYRRAIRELDRASKTPHHGRCGRCRAVEFLALLDGDAHGLRLAARLVGEHSASGVDLAMPACPLVGCVLHEDLPFPVARRMMKLRKAAPPRPDDLGGKTALVDLRARPDDRPPGFPDQDIATVFLRFTRRRVSAHVWVDPPEGRHPEFHTLEAVATGWDRHFPATRDWSIARYREFRHLADADLQVDPPRGWELRAPFGPGRGRD